MKPKPKRQVGALLDRRLKGGMDARIATFHQVKWFEWLYAIAWRSATHLRPSVWVTTLRAASLQKSRGRARGCDARGAAPFGLLLDAPMRQSRLELENRVCEPARRPR